MPVEYYCELAGMMVDCAIIKDMINDIIPDIPNHLKNLGIEICLDNLLYKWLVGLFFENMNKETSFQIYDAFFLEGNIIIFRTCLAILMICKEQILSYDNLMDLNNFFEEKIKEFSSNELLSLIINEKNEKFFNFTMDEINSQRDEKFIRIREQIKKTGEYKRKQAEKNSPNLSNECNAYYPNCLKLMSETNIIRAMTYKNISEPIFENNFYDISNGKRNVYELVKSSEIEIKKEEKEINLMNEKDKKKAIYEDLLMERINHKCKKKLKIIKRRTHSSRMMSYLFDQLNNNVYNDDDIIDSGNNSNIVNKIIVEKKESQNSLNVSRIINLSEGNENNNKRTRWTIVKRNNNNEEEKKEEDKNEREVKYKQVEKSEDEEEKKNEEEKEKSDDEEEKKERKSNSSKSNKSEDKEKEEEKEKEKEEEENIITEINPDLEERASAVKYDVSEKNENSFIYRIYNEEKDIFILEDKSKKDKNNVRCLVCRYIFANSDPRKKIFHATIKKQRDLKSQTKKNCLIMDEVKDNVLPHQNTCFMILQRFRDNLEFIKKDDIVISIGFDQN